MCLISAWRECLRRVIDSKINGLTFLQSRNHISFKLSFLTNDANIFNIQYFYGSMLVLLYLSVMEERDLQGHAYVFAVTKN